MTFIELRDLLVQEASEAEVTFLWEELAETTTYAELIHVCISAFDCAWKRRILTTDILDEIPDADLVAAGIYYNKTGVLTLPTIPYHFFEGYELFVVGGSPVITLVDDRQKVNIYSGNATVITQGTAFLDLSLYNSTCDLTAQDQSFVRANFRNLDSQVVTLDVEDDAKVYIKSEAYTVLNIDSVSATSFTKINQYAFASTNVAFGEDTSILNIIRYQQSEINYNPV